MTRNLKDCKVINFEINFDFPSKVEKIKQTEDASFLIAYGEYPPQIRCFDLYNLDLKFQRTINTNVNDFLSLSHDWKKLVLLNSNKMLEFHSKSGYYYSIKLPKLSKSLIFNKYSGILYIFSIDGEISRFDTNQSKFITSIKSIINAYNTSSVANFSENFLGAGNSKGIIEIWDLRNEKYPVIKIENDFSTNDSVFSLDLCKKNTHKLYCGFSSGNMIIYDIRNSNPIIHKKTKNKRPTHTIKKIKKTNLILSANATEAKLWNEINGKTIITIKTNHHLNHICHLEDTGFVFLSTMKIRIESKYIPLLGPIPSWCYVLKKKEKKQPEQLSYFKILQQNFKKNYYMQLYLKKKNLL